MKKYILLLFSAITMLFSCNTADHKAIREQLRDHEERIQKLEVPEVRHAKVLAVRPGCGFFL